jgi:magnesium chelatase subunit I
MMREVLTAFEEGAVAHAGEDISSGELIALLTQIPALMPPVKVLTGGDDSPAMLASAVEFILEGLHLTRRLNKDASGSKATYRPAEFEFPSLSFLSNCTNNGVTGWC